MEFMTNLPRKTTTFDHYIPTKCKKQAKMEIIEECPMEIVNDQTHVLIKHNSAMENPLKRNDDSPDTNAPIIKRTSRVISIQTPLN